MDKGQFLIETHLKTGRPIAELAAANGVSRGWLYKLLQRYRREGLVGLEPCSRRPKSSPTRIADLYEDEIVRVRKELAEAGFDAGAATIHFHMASPGRQVPSVSTIHRVLVARGFVIPEPHKRPKSSWKRFAAEFPNECWQADVTHVEVADGVVWSSRSSTWSMTTLGSVWLRRSLSPRVHPTWCARCTKQPSAGDIRARS